MEEEHLVMVFVWCIVCFGGRGWWALGGVVARHWQAGLQSLPSYQEPSWQWQLQLEYSLTTWGLTLLRASRAALPFAGWQARW